MCACCTPFKALGPSRWAKLLSSADHLVAFSEQSVGTRKRLVHKLGKERRNADDITGLSWASRIICCHRRRFAGKLSRNWPFPPYCLSSHWATQIIIWIKSSFLNRSIEFNLEPRTNKLINFNGLSFSVAYIFSLIREL